MLTAQSASDSIAHEQLFWTVMKSYLFSHCSRTLGKVGFQKGAFSDTC
jgi:hypothetical protein